MLKTCTKCGRTLDISQFHKDKRNKDGHVNQCKDCVNAYTAAYDARPENKLRKKLKSAEYRQKPENIKKMKEYSKNYRETHKEQILQYSREYNKRPDVQEKKRQTGLTQEFKQKKNTINNKRRFEDPYYRLSMNMYSLINACLSGQIKESLSLYQRCGYTTQQLRQHIESQFTSEMNWSNYGSYWEVDHIEPRIKFYYESYNDEQFKQCWALSNLRPLTVKENQSRLRYYKEEEYV